ncbi:MAG: RNA polymerase sigma factor [Candidatus Azobacteroides sp.]|nr:RNA polymerase sigma factor [Candidatus Azobacteroides sp.]
MHHDIFINKILPLKDKLFRFALGTIKNVNEAEDIIQDAMVKIWNKRDEWVDIDNMEGYCYRTVRNLLLDRVQSKDYQNEPYEVKLHDKRDDKDPFTRLVHREEITYIHKLIDSLPEPQQTTLRLRDIEGMAYLQIAEILNISETQVKNHLFRGRQKIKQLFEKIYNYEHP